MAAVPAEVGAAEDRARRPIRASVVGLKSTDSRGDPAPAENETSSREER